MTVSSGEPLKVPIELGEARSLLLSLGWRGAGTEYDRMVEELHGASPPARLCFLISENSEMLPKGKVWVNICPDVETGQIRREDERDTI